MSSPRSPGYPGTAELHPGMSPSTGSDRSPSLRVSSLQVSAKIPRHGHWHASWQLSGGSSPTRQQCTPPGLAESWEPPSMGIPPAPGDCPSAPGEEFSSGVQPEPPRLQSLAVVPRGIIWRHGEGFDSITLAVGSDPLTSSWPGYPSPGPPTPPGAMGASSITMLTAHLWAAPVSSHPS